MTPSPGSTEVAGSPEFFRMSLPLLRRLPVLASRAGKLNPKLDVLVLLGLCAQVGRRPKSELAIGWSNGSLLTSVAFRPRIAELLTDLGYQRRGSEFSGSAWSAVTACIDRLAQTPVTIPFMWKPPGKKRLEAAKYRGPLLELLDSEKAELRMYGYSPPKDRYYALVPRKLLSLRPELSELGTRLACWLYAQHRGARSEGRLKHKWTMHVTPEWLVEAKFLRSQHVRRASELARMRAGFTNLERLGLLSVAGDAWPHRVQLSPTFFHQDGAHE